MACEDDHDDGCCGMFVPRRPPRPPLWHRIVRVFNPFYWYRRWKFSRGFRRIVFPAVRTPFPVLLANDLVSVQPMQVPSGSLFDLEYKYTMKKEEP